MVPSMFRFMMAKLFVIEPALGVCHALTDTDVTIKGMLMHTWYDGYDRTGELTTNYAFPVNVRSDKQYESGTQFSMHASARTLWVGPQLDARIILTERGLRAVPKLERVSNILAEWATDNTNAWKEIVFTRSCLEKLLTIRDTHLNNLNLNVEEMLVHFCVPQQVVQALVLFWEACELGPECYPIDDQTCGISAPEQYLKHKRANTLWSGKQGLLRKHLSLRSLNMLQTWSDRNKHLLPRARGEFIISVNEEQFAM